MAADEGQADLNAVYRPFGGNAPKLYPNIAKAVKVLASRHQGCRCGRPPQNLGNEEDEAFTAFPEGKKISKNDEFLEFTFNEVLNCSKFDSFGCYLNRFHHFFRFFMQRWGKRISI